MYKVSKVIIEGPIPSFSTYINKQKHISLERQGNNANNWQTMRIYKEIKRWKYE